MGGSKKKKGLGFRVSDYRASILAIVGTAKPCEQEMDRLAPGRPG
jgi:hypothetical protein